MEKFAHNKYRRWYYYIIDHAKCQGRNRGDDYYESHHIIPTCMGGTETVLLTAREHYVCHLLLTKMCLNAEDKMKMFYALTLMNGNNKHHVRYKPKSRLYEYARREHAKNVSITHTGKIVSAETRERLGARQRGVGKSDKHKASLKANHKGMTGRKHSRETIEKMRLARLKRV